MARLKVESDGFDVFAEPQAIDTKIHAVANGMLRRQIAYFDRVGQAACGFDSEIGEDGMLRVGVGNDEHFLTRALAALVDFVGVGGAPVVGWWELKLLDWF